MSMLNLVDFIKKPFALKVPPEFEKSFLEEYMSESRQAYWINKFLGLTEGQNFIADLAAGVPQSPKYITLFDEIDFDHYGYYYRYEGLKKSLIRAIYCDYISAQPLVNTDSGSQTTPSVAGDEQNAFDSTVKWNELVLQMDNLELYIAQNRSDYPDYQKQQLELRTWL